MVAEVCPIEDDGNGGVIVEGAGVHDGVEPPCFFGGRDRRDFFRAEGDEFFTLFRVFEDADFVFPVFTLAGFFGPVRANAGCNLKVGAVVWSRVAEAESG